ncbi:MAG: secretion protein HlyD family protein [Pseudomonadota bacterium]
MTAPTPNDTTALQNLLGAEAHHPWWRRQALLIGAGALLVAGAGAAWWLWGGSAAEARKAVQYVTTPVSRGNVQLTVSANGTLAPTRSVSIGSELSGTVARVMVDVNDPVKKGQILVELDTAKLRDQIARSRATLASSQAKLLSAQAAQQEAQAALARLDAVRRLSDGRVPAQADLTAAQATQAQARADVQAAQAAVADARAALSTDETNLGKASIRSPIDGVVLTRAVEPGNAVAASLQAVTLFTLAPDLRQLLLNVNVDEADVGAVAIGQPARFTVSAHAGRTFDARITRVAYGSTITDNVVTYTTQMAVANPDLALRPGMTATATITATAHDGVLRVPLSALRYQPSGAAATAAGGGGTAAGGGGTAGGSGPGADAPGGAGSGGAAAGGAGSGGNSGSGGGGNAGGSSVLSRLMPRPPGASSTSRRGDGSAAAGAAGSARTVWLLKDGRPQAVPVTVGLNDGKWVEVSGPGLAEGQAVITDQRTGSAP